MATAVDLYDKWHTSHRAQDERPTADAPWHLMAERHLKHVGGQRVLEIGCGRGAFAELLAGRGARLTAADFSPVCVAETAGRLRGYPTAEATLADVQHIPFPDNTFDFVVSLETLEHVPDPDRALRELVRVGKPGAVIIITGPNYMNLSGLHRIYLRLTGRRYSESGQPINQPLMFPVRVWKLRRAGCWIIRTESQSHLIPVRRCPRLERIRALRWLGYDTLTVAVKRAPGKRT